MNPPRRNHLPVAAKWLGALLAALVLLPTGHAQTNTGGGRWLLIFDASFAMKKRLPATEAAVRRFFSTHADGQMEDGDSVGVWTFDRQINAQFPTFTWSSEPAAPAVSNLVAFLHRQRYQTESSAALLQAPLKHVVAGSRRLTVILVTDGAGEIAGTPYDPGVNRTFADERAERKKNRQPFAVVMRSQFGKFVGCTVNFPPGDLNLPPFPPPPPVVVAPPPVVVAPPPAPVPALVIVGTHVSTDTNDLVEKPVVAAPTNAVVTPAVQRTNPPTAPTNPPPVKAETKPVAPPTNAPAVRAAAEAEKGTSALIYAGMGLLALALAAVLAVRISRRRPQSSLITSSMENDSRRD